MKNYTNIACIDFVNINITLKVMAMLSVEMHRVKTCTSVNKLTSRVLQLMMTKLSVETHHVKTCTCVNKSTSRAYCS